MKNNILDRESMIATQLRKIRENINTRMSNYNDSRQPTTDEVTIAWLLTEVERLQGVVIDKDMEIRVLSDPELNSM